MHKQTPHAAHANVVALPLTEAQLQALVDGLFAYLEVQSQRPILNIVEQIINKTVDAELPAILSYLAGKGIITTLP